MHEDISSMSSRWAAGRRLEWKELVITMIRSHDGAGVDVLVVEHVHVVDLRRGGVGHGLRCAADEARRCLLVVGAADVG